MTDEQSAFNPLIGPTSKMSFAVAGCAFIAAIVGVFINQWLSGWMAVGGMTGVGLFYVAVGLLNLGAQPVPASRNDELVETSSHRLSNIANVDDVAVVRDRESDRVSSDRVSQSEDMANASR